VLGLKLGVITNVPDNVSKQDVVDMLANANVLQFIEKRGIITSVDAGAQKPKVQIYRYAAKAVAQSVGDCLYIGEDPKEVAGAIQSGMLGMLKPS
jgi:FMN phosphatase YigB (HAD superfamily)